MAGELLRGGGGAEGRWNAEMALFYLTSPHELVWWDAVIHFVLALYIIDSPRTLVLSVCGIILVHHY
jgi:hypothetical protein